MQYNFPKKNLTCYETYSVSGQKEHNTVTSGLWYLSGLCLHQLSHDKQWPYISTRYMHVTH